MAYRLELDEGLHAGLRRAILEELQHAAGQLRPRKDQEPVEAVHEARKSMKKARAVLRLVRKPLGKQTFRQENGVMRDIGRELAGARDADVMVQTLDGLRDRATGHVGKTALDELRAHLAEQAQGTRVASGRRRAALVREVRALEQRVEQWPLGDADWATVRSGMTRSYRAGRKAFARAHADPTVENLHEWRKRAKDFWYHHRLTRDLWPEVMKPYGSAAHELSDVLGDDHDLAVLRSLVAEGRDAAAVTPADLDPLVEVIDERRAELLEAARRLGRRLYAERPQAFAARLDAYLEAVGAESRALAPV
jgi:CHAD domain-containing protein